MTVGLIFAGLLVLLGIGTGYRQVHTLRRLRQEPFTPDIDRRYLRGQVIRRFSAAVLLTVIGGMIAFYYLSGMDARLDEIPERNKGAAPPAADDPQAQDDRAFTRFVAIYWIGVIVLLGLVVLVAILDFWATRVYWLARYREIKADHETKLQRDLAVYRQQRLDNRAKGLRKVDDDTTPEDSV